MSSGEKGTDLGVTSKAAWVLKRGRFHRGLRGGGVLGDGTRNNQPHMGVSKNRGTSKSMV